MKRLLNRKYSSKKVVEENFKKLVHGKEYRASEYDVHTNDGYHTKLFRLTANSDPLTKRRVVWLQHGLLHSSDTWLLNYEHKALAFVLARKGFDVWLGNNRGNKYARTHLSLNRDDERFWDFSFQEMGVQDVPAILRRILAETGAEKVTYVGHSQGNSQMFVALTDDHSHGFVNRHLDLFVALSPIVYLANQLDESLRSACAYDFGRWGRKLGFHEILPGGKSSVFDRLGKLHKSVSSNFPSISDSIIAKLTGGNPQIDDFSRFDVFLQHQPSGCSLRCIEHFQQMILQDQARPRFQAFDFGPEKNLKEYSRPDPPVYDFARIRVPVRGLVAGMDKLSSAKDNELLAADLQGCGVDYRATPFEACGHMTYVYGKNPTALFEKVLQLIHSTDRQ